jgi:hypothetical protein
LATTTTLDDASGTGGHDLRLRHRFAAAEMDEAQFRQTRRALETALRMFEERAELARRLAGAQRRRGRPVSAEHWEAATREMEDAAEVLRRLFERGWRPDPEGGEDASGPA